MPTIRYSISQKNRPDKVRTAIKNDSIYVLPSMLLAAGLSYYFFLNVAWGR
jgi:hypothetical protein